MNAPARPVLVYAHRGASARLPENTLESFALALDAGVDALETDVHLTSDGVPVLSHDPDGQRNAGVRSRIATSTLSELKRWDVATTWRRSHPEVTEAVRIPTLEEALRAFPDTRFNIDLKQKSPALAAAVLEVIGRLNAKERVCVASFHDAMLALVRLQAPELMTSLGPAQVRWLAFAPRRLLALRPLRGQRAQIPVSAGPVRFDNARFLDKAHALGLSVDFWVINDPEKAGALVEMGADGIVTDDPGRIVPVVRERQRLC